MAAGKGYLDTRQALADLGMDEAVCAQIGIRLLKIGCGWPLNAQDAREFATGLDEILLIEEKSQILEYALKVQLYNWLDDLRPRVYDQVADKETGSEACGERGGPDGRIWVDRGTDKNKLK